MRRAFTMIEVLVATALGAVLCLGAVAALRTAQDCTTSAQRLSLENGLMRAGLQAALKELDDWSEFDRPSVQAVGQPFAPHDFTQARTFAAADWAAFDPAAPRQWFRGDASHSDPFAHGDFPRLSHRQHAEPDRAFVHDWLRYVVDRFGYYAALDFAPANWIYHLQPAADGASDPEFRECDFGTYCTPSHFYSIGFGSWQQPRDRMSANYLEGVVATTDPVLLALPSSRITFHLGGWLDARTGLGWNELYRDGAQRFAPMPLRPGHWPDLRVTTRRVIAHAQRIHAATIDVTSPVTGKHLRLYLTTACTTLRGARLTRGLDPAP